MTTYSLNPTYYRVTWNQTSPTNYSAVANNSVGGLDSETAWQINSLVMTTGTANITGTPLTNLATIIINGYTITFSNTDNIASIIDKINLFTKFTNVTANQQISGGYLTLQNAPGFEGNPFWIREGNGTALSQLGLTAGTYSSYPSVVGTTFTAVTTNSNVTINGYNIQFTSGPLTTSGVATQMNAVSTYTGVVAQPAGPYLQLTAVGGQPWVINSGNAQSNMGFTVGNFGGFPSTLANSQAKERANMRWNQVINEVESVSTPNFWGNIIRSGNIANVATDTISFTIGVEQPDYLRTVALTTEPDSGTVFVGTAAIKRSVARALTANMISNRKVFDPTLDNFGTGCNRANPAQIQSITAAGIDTVANITIVESNITVTQITGV